jgi:hypothetical protein
MPKPIFMKFVPGTHLSGAIHKHFSSAYVIIARQQFCENITATMHIHETIEELFYTSFFIKAMSYQIKAGD